MSQERQYERKVVKDSVSNRKSDVQDNSITDITIIDFDTAPIDPPAIKRIVHIHRQNDIQTNQSDSTIIQAKDSLKSHEIVQNKSSPDKASQALFSTATIFIILLITLVILFFIIVEKKSAK